MLVPSRSVSRLVASALVLCFVAGCGAGQQQSASPKAAGDLVVDGQVDNKAMKAEVARIAALSEQDRESEVASLDAKVERQLWTWSGLEEALGGAEAADAAFAATGAALAKLADEVEATPLVKPSRATTSSQAGAVRPAAYLRSQAGSADTPTIGMGLFGGMIMMSVVPALVGGTNNIADGPPRTEELRDGFGVTASVGEVELALDKTFEEGGVTTTLRMKLKVKPCPDAQGRFEGSAHIEMSATAKGGSVGQKSTVEVAVTGQIDDDAKLVSSDLEYRMDMADFAGGKGSYVDVSGSFGDTAATSARVNRTGGSGGQAQVTAAVVLGMLMAYVAKDKIVEGAQKGWESGRCVKLGPTAAPGPSGLEPSEESKISAQPRSRIDGAPTGGTVTARLVSGGVSISPSDSKVKADATFTYQAPDERDKTASVDLEARSKRGVAKASVTLDTKQGAYVASGGTQVTVSGTVPDLAKPFSLKGVGQGFTVTYSYTPKNDRSGTVTYTGSGGGFTMKGSGSYTIGGEDPVLNLEQTTHGCVSIGGCRDQTNVITLTREGS